MIINYDLVNKEDKSEEKSTTFTAMLKTHDLVKANPKDSVDVLPPIACHGGTQDSCSGFDE
jgi:hypothetical protein